MSEIEKNEFEILDKLKAGLLQVNGLINASTDYFGSEKYKNSKKEIYYLKDLKNNLFKRELPANNLGKDPEAVRSSAAMIYNTIGENSITFDNNKYLIKKYEDGYDAIKIKGGTAYLDVSLYIENKEKFLFIESKCLEWLSSSENLKASYLNETNYFSKQAADNFIPVFKKIINNPEKERNEYSSIYTRYNSKQMTIHILGIYNWCKENFDSNEFIPSNITLMNLVWDYDNAEEYQTEEKEGLEYVAFANVTFRNIFKELGVDFKVEYVRYSDFLNRVDWTNDLERRIYLRRYEIKKTLSDSEFITEYPKLWKETWHYGDKQNKIIDNIFYYSNYSKEDINGERWVSLKYIKGYTKYSVSNLGRVKYNGEIVEQSDEKHPGYLKLDPEHKLPVDHSINVYTLVAIGFLGKRFDDGYDVHHKNNNGKDCRVENLILLTRKQHNAVHHKTELVGDELIKFLIGN